MEVTDNFCNWIIVITGLLATLITFSKEIASLHTWLTFVDNLFFKIFLLMLCVVLGAIATVQKEKNNDKKKDKFEATLKRRHGSDSLALYHDSIALSAAQDSLSSLSDTIRSKDNSLIDFQNETINEIKGGDLPISSSHISESEEGIYFVIEIGNSSAIPVPNAEILYGDPFKENIQKDTTFSYLIPQEKRILVYKNLKDVPDGTYSYFIHIIWRLGNYSYQVGLNKKNGVSTVNNELYYYKHGVYTQLIPLKKFTPPSLK